MTVWWTRYTRQGVVATFVVGLIVALAFTAAKYAGLETLVGLPVLVNPALYAVPAAFLAGIVVSLLTKDVGDVDHFMHLAHDRDGRDSNGGEAAEA